MVVSRLFERLSYSNERSSKFEMSLPRIEVFRGGKWQYGTLQISPTIESLYGLGRQATKL